MHKEDRFRWFKQFAAISIVIFAVGSSATYLVYRQARESAESSGKSFLITTAVQSAQFVNESPEAREAGISAWSPGVKRVTIFNEDSKGQFRSRPSDVFKPLVLRATDEIEEAITTQLPVVSSVRLNEDGVPARVVYVPLASTSLALVEIDEQVLSLPKDELDRSFRSALFAVFLLGVAFSMVLCGAKWMDLSAFRSSLGKLTTRRVWITIGLLATSGALLFDGAHGHSQVSQASERGHSAERTLTVCNETSSAISYVDGSVERERIESASDYFRSIGEHGIAELGDELASLKKPDPSLAVLYRLRLNDLETKALLTFREASETVIEQNRAQSIRLAMVVALGLFAVLLMSAVSVKERQIELTLDETSLAKLEYASLIGNLPIGLFAYSNGKVVFSNGAWNVGEQVAPEDVLDRLPESDKSALMSALDMAQFDKKPFQGTVKIPSPNGVNHYETYGAPVVDNDGRLKRILVFCIDVTPLVNANAEIQRKHEEVEEKN